MPELYAGGAGNSTLIAILSSFAVILVALNVTVALGEECSGPSGCN